MSYPPPAPYYPPPEEPQPAWAAAPPPAPPKKKHTTLIVVSVLVGLMLCIVGSLVIGGFAADQPASKPTTFTEPAPAGSAAANKGAPAPKTKKAGPVVIGAGDWVVGDDVKAGTYKTNGADASVITFCSWTVRENDDPGAEIVDFGTSSSTKETGRVKLKNGQSFETSGCKDWVRQ